VSVPEKPRIRSSIESAGGKSFQPSAPSFATSPNLGSSAYRQDATQNNTFLIASDTVTQTSGPVSLPAAGYATLFSAIVPFPNIPFFQRLSTGSKALSTGQPSILSGHNTAGSFTFRVSGVHTAPSANFIIASFSVTPHVVDSTGAVRTSSSLGSGSDFKSFGALVTIMGYNPGAAIGAATVTFAINGDLSLTYGQQGSA
jgi:hypothetical protein